MAICYNCKKNYREPEDEQGDHNCPRCDYYWYDDEELLIGDDLSE